MHEKSCFNNDPLTAFAADQLAPSDCLLVGSGAEEAESWFFHPLYLNRASAELAEALKHNQRVPRPCRLVMPFVQQGLIICGADRG